jgi:quinohemoprotein ethanol dehydrogenase
MLKHTLLAAVLGFSMQSAFAAAPEFGAGANWTSHSGNADDGSYSRLKDINTTNIGKLGLATYLDLPGEQSLEATPLAVDGVLYFTGSYSDVYAVDALTSKILWNYKAENWKHEPHKLHYVLPVNRGAAYADGRVFSCTLDGRLLALDAKTGKLLWSVETLPPKSKHTCTGAPRTFNGKVLIGNGGADFAQRGYVTAYDAATGEQAWRFYTVPGSPDENAGDPTMEMAAKTWTGEYWKTGTGGTAWNGFTYDPDFNRVYIGTGNAGPYDPAIRSPGGGDNLFIASIVALDADTGKYIWHYQENPLEAWDYKSVANIIATTIKFEGKPRKVLLHAPTNGFFYVLDRETGKLLSAEKTGKVTWADRIDLTTGRPVERPNIRYELGEVTIWPGTHGGHNWQAMSFNPGTGLVYIPYIQNGVRFYRPKPGQAAFSGVAHEEVFQEPEDGTGALLAWDPVAQKKRWKVPRPGPWNGGTMTTAGNLVFQGTADGYFDAYDATTGKRLWRFNAGLGIVAEPITYMAGGKQYISILVGYGGASTATGDSHNMGWKFNAQPRRLLTFAVGGNVELPPSAPPDKKVYAVDDPAIKINEDDIEKGHQLALECLACHGPDLHSAGAPGPDLRESRVAMDYDALWAILHEGALLEKGMPRFEYFTQEQVRQIYAYIRASAREVLGTRKPPKTAPPNM